MTLSGQAPQRPPASAAVDEAWEDEEPDDEKTGVAEQPHVAQPATPQPPLATTPRAPASAPALASLTAEDLRTIVREMIDHAVLPLQHRIAELERRLRAPSMPAIVHQAAAVTPVAAAYALTPVMPHAAVPAAPITYASAMAAPAPAAPALRPALIVSTVPQVDIAALARDMPMDFDVPFDGRKRKRRMVMLFVLFLLAVGGGLAFMLVDSYSHTHN